MSTLDRERNDSYVLSVVARDGGAEPRSSNTTVYVTVLDENDNDPEILNIESLVTTVEVPEVRYIQRSHSIYRCNELCVAISLYASLIITWRVKLRHSSYITEHYNSL